MMRNERSLCSQMLQPVYKTMSINIHSKSTNTIQPDSLVFAQNPAYVCLSISVAIRSLHHRTHALSSSHPFIHFRTNSLSFCLLLVALRMPRSPHILPHNSHQTISLSLIIALLNSSHLSTRTSPKSMSNSFPTRMTQS
jgi:hypothetical protein